MLRLFFALLPGAPLVANAAALSLEDTFAAYVRVVTQDDELAKAALRDSLRAADPDDYPEVADIADKLHAFGNLAAGFEEPYASAISTRSKSIDCHALLINEDSSSSHGTVGYQCRLPDVSGALMIAGTIGHAHAPGNRMATLSTPSWVSMP